MEKTIKKKRDYTQGKILKNIILYAIPLALASLIQKLFHAADVAIIGQFAGSDYQAAIGSTGTISGLIVNFFVGFSVGVNVAMAHAHGAKDREREERVLHTGITLSLIAGVIVTVLCRNMYRFSVPGTDGRRVVLFIRKRHLLLSSIRFPIPAIASVAAKGGVCSNSSWKWKISPFRKRRDCWQENIM